MEQKIEAAFVVTINTDGTFAAHMEQPETPFEVQRPATAYDVLTISQGLVKEIEAGQLTDRIMIALLSVLQAAPPKPADVVKEKLKERGIDPESAPVNE
ncbi:hypothetical protein UFOVP111_26 [uncultured Caudovirales phage]|uniref:Uncharacterized protein n=1 Tax=uncultured Caudovirales phage TaxID=2100421 RepID=A0A6J5L983_9CAUD|nr:hypothetical protein UFOVP111_26 [uncultured Caudovirales phage]